VDGIDYCTCDKKVNSVYGAPTPDIAWTPFLERKVSFAARFDKNNFGLV
jgi:hypothetical protein